MELLDVEYLASCIAGAQPMICATIAKANELLFQFFILFAPLNKSYGDDGANGLMLSAGKTNRFESEIDETGSFRDNFEKIQNGKLASRVDLIASGWTWILGPLLQTLIAPKSLCKSNMDSFRKRRDSFSLLRFYTVRFFELTPPLRVFEIAL